MDLNKLFIQKKFEDYYSSCEISLPRNFRNREFAFVPMEMLPEFVMLRHISFRSYEDFRAYVLSKIPAHIYFSSAYYEKPDETRMEDKIWIGADLIFDIDADHLPLKTSSFERALDFAKKELKKLVTVLKSDFGIDEDSMKVYFSGGRGYHVHVFDSDFVKLDSAERREIVDYLTLNTPKIFDDGRMLNSNAARRILNYLKRKLEEDPNLSKRLKLSVKDLKRERLKKKTIEAIERFKTTAENILRIYIDAPVTADVRRLIRLPGSLHGKTGLRVTEVHDIENFDPLKDAIAFGDSEIIVRVRRKTSIKIGEVDLRLYPGRVKLPEYAAILLICRNLASYESTV